MQKPISLRLFLTVSMALLVGLVGGLTAWLVGSTASNQLERQIGASLATLADQMQDKLDRGLFERYRESVSVAGQIERAGLAANLLKLREVIEQVQSNNSDYVWLGYADHNGRILVATGGQLEGRDLSGRPWFEEARKRPAISDVHEPVLLLDFTLEQDRHRRQFIDIAAPVRRGDGGTAGVLVAILNWNWAEEVRDSLFSDAATNLRPDVMVLDRDGTVLLGEHAQVGSRLEFGGIKRAEAGKAFWEVEHWPDGRPYVVGYARSAGYRTFAGLGWYALVRQPADTAFAEVSKLRWQAALQGLLITVLSLLLATFLARRIATPLVRLTEATRQARQDGPASIPSLDSYQEVAELSRSLDELLTDLSSREASLETLNASLDRLVTERTEALHRRNEALSLARDEAEQATAAKSRFLSAASHDLRQPLHALLLLSRALSRRVEGDEARKLAGQLEQALTSLRSMFDALLDISRLDTGQIVPRKEAVSAAAILDKVAAAFLPEAEERSLRLRHRSIKATVTTDAAMLETILRNLVSNALKFTRQGGVLLTARRIGNDVAFEVYDSGPGIAPEESKRIFHEFERGAAAAESTVEGLGLGLAIVDRYARLLGGRCDFRSRLGRGTRFRLRIPVNPVPTVATSTLPPEHDLPAQGSLEGRRILVIDDDPLIVSALVRDLSDRGALAEGVQGGADEGRFRASGFKPDCAVVDLDLQGSLTGPDLVRQWQSMFGRPIPVIVLTGRTDKAATDWLRHQGLRWITKPADPQIIAMTLQSMLAKDMPDGGDERSSGRKVTGSP